MYSLKDSKEIFKNYITNGTDYIKEIYHSNVIENERIDDLKNDEEASSSKIPAAA